MAEAFGIRTTLFVLAGICATGLATAVAYRKVVGLPWSDARPEPVEEGLASAAG
jgi:hypothetical protein